MAKIALFLKLYWRVRGDGSTFLTNFFLGDGCFVWGFSRDIDYFSFCLFFSSLSCCNREPVEASFKVSGGSLRLLKRLDIFLFVSVPVLFLMRDRSKGLNFSAYYCTRVGL